MIHKSFRTSADATVPLCLAHEPESTGFATTANDAEVDCPLCKNPRKARKYARAFANRLGALASQRITMTERGASVVVR